MNKSFDPDKPVQTRYGKEARIICYDALTAHASCLVALVVSNEVELPYKYRIDGRRFRTCKDSYDLVNVPVVPVVRSGYTLIHLTGSSDNVKAVGFRFGSLHKTYEEALELSKKYPTTVAIIPIEFKEGEGLDTE